MRALDTNIIIYHLLKDKTFWKKSAEIMRSIEDGEDIFLPLPVLKETLFELRRHRKELSEIIEIFASFQKDNIKIAEDDFETFIQGLEIAGKNNVNPTDGIIAALMFKHKVSEIYSNDSDFDRIPGIKRVF